MAPAATVNGMSLANMAAPIHPKEIPKTVVGGTVVSKHIVGKLVVETKLFINGCFVDATGGKCIKTINPANEEVIETVQEASEADVDRAVEAATTAFRSWQLIDGHNRRNLLNRLADLIELHKMQLAEIESRDAGKPITNCIHVDLKLVVDVFRYYAGWADKIQGKTVPIQSLSQNGNNQYLCFTRHEPIGVVGQIIPWNFPLLMMAWKLAPALAVGCCCVLKTSEKTPLSGLMLCHLINEAGFPKGVVNVISGHGPTTGEAMVKHPGIAKIAFTGSSKVGQHILMKSAEFGMKRVSLELGGKSPLIVFDDADLDKAVEVAHLGLFFNMGQCCIACSRVYVQESVHDKFLEKCVARAHKAKLSCPKDQDCTHGPQVDKIQFDKIMQHIEVGKKEGAKCCIGGKKKDGKGYYIEPTVFSEVQDKMKICQEEIFGPVMCVLKFKTVDEVIERANASQYGLGAGVCTVDMGKAMRVTNNLKAGTVYVNCYDVFDAAAPFGGYKQSGMGRELGEYGLEPYYEVKTVIADLTLKDEKHA
eukprot:GHVS01080225.1.p1 GENE.GHVS01080225.1~~GHVS01080225.1.p1  ORF type:complete len:534 (+),score=87.87 GHVS01080225.1:88-1689(+)